MVTIKSEAGKLINKALIAKYESEISEAEGILTIYFNNPVGIGEHSDLLVEYDKFVEKLTNAKDKLETVKAFTIDERVNG